MQSSGPPLSSAALWEILLPVALGTLAVYGLLPRAGRRSSLPSYILGTVALFLVGLLVVPVGSLTPETLLFYAFSGLAIAGGTQLITQPNPVHAALSFALVVLSTCGLFLLLAAPFLMAATVIVYAGAIVVTFLFVIMLAQQAGFSDADQRSREPALATIAGFALLVTLLLILKSTYDTSSLDKLLDRASRAEARLARSPASELHDEIDDLARGFAEEAQRLRGLPESKLLLAEAENLRAESPDAKVFRDGLTRLQASGRRLRAGMGNLEPKPGNDALSSLSGTAANQEPRRDRDMRPQMPAENVAYLGRSLFSDFLLPVELAGTILLVATIGAIVITHRRPEATS
jgi:NADH-quinone oxidoreductase subunit J